MNVPDFLGDFPQVAIALTLSFGCALVLAFFCLRFVVRLVTREQYNVTDDPRRIRALVWHGDGLPGDRAADAGSSHATSGPYLLPAASPRNRFARIPEPGGAPRGRILQLPQRPGAGADQDGPGDGGSGAA